ncbi:MAG: citrate/2-methylcitrate synthase [Clostridia bacterium]|nr:citrate/2-methylcitrate synthase [Clostridia bacterium]
MSQKRDHSAILPEVEALTRECEQNGAIDRELYERYQVNRGLRDVHGNGVLTGLTQISEVNGRNPDGSPCEGELYYRGLNVKKLVRGFLDDARCGFEETAYLLLFGKLPDGEALSDFEALLGSLRTLPTSFTRDVIMKAPSSNLMNSMARSVLTLYAYDDKADLCDLDNVLRQCLLLIAVFPQLALYSYQAYAYYLNEGSSFFIHDPQAEKSTAENILYMLRPDGAYTPTEAAVLDLALVLHAEHGGGNNSTFTNHVVTSSGTDTYSAMAASLGSLKGPKHGGANIKVCHMFRELKTQVADWEDEDEIAAYLNRLLNKDAFDRSGLIYGIGHAIYSRSDPRAVILKEMVAALAREKGCLQEFSLYERVEKLAPRIIASQRRMYKGVSANVDFYSGFMYQLLGIPEELFTPMFAVGRIAGWSAHRLEELINGNRIIRPAYKAVQPRVEYRPLKAR